MRYDTLLENTLHSVRLIAEFYHANSKYPSYYTEDQLEKSMFNKRATLRSAKYGKCDATWYPQAEALAIELKCPNMFNYNDREVKTLNDVEAIVKFYKETGKFPSRSNKDVAISKLATKVMNLQYIKAGKLPGIWYSSIDEYLIECGLPNLFDIKSDTKIEPSIENVCIFYKTHNRCPSQLDKSEVSTYRDLVRLRQIKSGKCLDKWKSEYDEISRRYECEHIFDYLTDLSR